MPATPDTQKFMQDLASVVREHVGAAVRPINERLRALESRPAPQDGKSITVDDVKPVILQIVKTETDSHVDLMREAVVTIFDPINARVDALEKREMPEVIHGNSVTLDDVKPMVSQLVKDEVAAVPVKEPVGIKNAIIDRDGALIFTLSNGDKIELGVIVGKDADMPAIISTIKEEIGKIPTPKDGKDGFGFDDLQVEFDGERTVTLAFVKGNEHKEFSLVFPNTIYRGVYKEGQEYKRGDQVTWAGSQWTAKQDTSDKPETSDAWQLTVKRGRDGKKI